MIPEEEVCCPVCGGCNRKTLYSLGEYRAVICLQCRFKYVSPQLSRAQLSEYYAKMYSDEIFKRDFEGRRHDMFGDAKERVNKIRDRHVEIELTDRFCKKGRVLDIGSGSGLYFEGLKGEHELYGIEMSLRAAEYVEERFEAKIKCCDVLEAEYEEGFFDVVNMTYTIEHLKSPRAVLERVASWLRPGGMLVVSSPNWSSPMARLYREFFRLNDPCQHINLWETNTLRRFLKEVGFRVENVHFPYFRTEYFNPYELGRLVVNTATCLLLPILLQLGVYPEPDYVLSPPFWGSIMVFEAYK